MKKVLLIGAAGFIAARTGGLLLKAVSFQKIAEFFGISGYTCASHI